MLNPAHAQPNQGPFHSQAPPQHPKKQGLLTLLQPGAPQQGKPMGTQCRWGACLLSPGWAVLGLVR